MTVGELNKQLIACGLPGISPAQALKLLHYESRANIMAAVANARTNHNNKAWLVSLLRRAGVMVAQPVDPAPSSARAVQPAEPAAARTVVARPRAGRGNFVDGGSVTGGAESADAPGCFSACGRYTTLQVWATDLDSKQPVVNIRATPRKGGVPPMIRVEVDGAVTGMAAHSHLPPAAAPRQQARDVFF